MDHVPQTRAGSDRGQLDFVGQARAWFGFLLDLGFVESCAETTFLRFERADSFVDVFHGRASFELGVEFGRWVDVDDEVVEQKFHIGDVLSALAPSEAFTAHTATSQEQITRFMEELAASTKLAAEKLESGGFDGFDRISEAVERQSDKYLDNIRATRLRAHAKDAWRRKDYASMITAYQEIESELKSVELRESEVKRLSYARRNLNA